MKKFLFLLLVVTSVFSLSAIDLSPNEYDVQNGYFSWKDIQVNLKDGAIDTIDVNALYHNGDGTAINGRTWGIFIAEYGSAAEAEMFYNVSHTINGKGINVPSNVANEYYKFGLPLYTAPTKYNQTSNSKVFQKVTIPNEILKNASLDKQYRVYLWTDAGSAGTSFEGCLGILTNISVTQYLDIENQWRSEIKTSFNTLAIDGAKLNTKVLPLKSAVFSTEKTGPLESVVKDRHYDLYYDHVHSSTDTDWTFAGEENYVIAYCAEERCPQNKEGLRLQVNPHYKEDIIASANPPEASFQTFDWSSSDETIVTVNSFGQTTALTEGTADITIKAKDESGVSAVCHVTVEKQVI